MKIPILLITYRKHEFLTKILDEIAKYSPPILYVYQDIEKDSKENVYTQNVKEIIENFSFNGVMEYTRHPHHMGLNPSVLTAINSVFEKEEKLIILEDDTIPTQSFFKFCEIMLEKHKDDKDIGVISGCNLNTFENKSGFFSSSYAMPFWGWATWREKWNLFDLNQLDWKIVQQNSDKFKTNKGFLQYFFKRMTLDVAPWDIQWSMVLMHHNQKAILPCSNLITNKGFIKKGTYTNYEKSNFSSLCKYDFTDFDLMEVSADSYEKKYQKKSATLLKEIVKNTKDDYFSKINIFLSNFHLK